MDRGLGLRVLGRFGGHTERRIWGVVAVLAALAAVTIGGAVADAVTPSLPIPDDNARTGWVEVRDPTASQRFGAVPAIGGVTHRDVPYVLGAHSGCTGAGSDEPCSGSQTLDVYKSDGFGPRPVAVWLHSGGWVGGDKTEVTTTVRWLRHRGFDVVAVNYRLASGPDAARFPAAVHDVKAAVRWVKANAEAYGFHPGAVLAIGESAGGHLTQMLATSAGVDGLEPTAGLSVGQAIVDSTVDAAVSISGMGDIPAFLQDRHPWAESLTRAFLGCSYDCPSSLPRQASATSHVTGDDAPVLAITGEHDALAFPRVADLLGSQYTSAGIGSRFYDDAVDSGPSECRGHVPWCGANRIAFEVFVDSVRAVASRPGAERFIDAAHRDLLDRPATRAELDRWWSSMDWAEGRWAMVTSLARSEQWVGAVVDRFYRDTLGRAPDAAGRAYWVDKIVSGQVTVAGAAGYFYASDEYYHRVGGHLWAWVDDLYAKLLRRSPDSSGRTYWVRVALHHGRPAVALPFYQSTESRMIRVAALYQELLGRAPDRAGQEYWAGVIARTGDDVDLAVNLVVSREYRLRTQR